MRVEVVHFRKSCLNYRARQYVANAKALHGTRIHAARYHRRNFAAGAASCGCCTRFDVAKDKAGFKTEGRKSDGEVEWARYHIHPIPCMWKRLVCSDKKKFNLGRSDGFSQY